LGNSHVTLLCVYWAHMRQYHIYHEGTQFFPRLSLSPHVANLLMKKKDFGVARKRN
jgi:hypothetical protein